MQIRAMKLKTLLLCAVVGVFLVVGPAIIERILSTPQVPDIFTNPPRPFEGVLHVWQVGAWNMGTGSRTLFLKARAAEFEQKHAGVFIEVHGMTEDDANALIRKYGGITADMVSFGPGFIENPAEVLMPLKGKHADVKAEALKATSQNGTVYALPYMLGAYGLLIRHAYFDEVQQEIPQAVKVGELSSLFRAFDKLTRGSGRKKKPVFSLEAGRGGLYMLMVGAQQGEKNALFGVAQKVPEDIGALDDQKAGDRFIIDNSSAMLVGTQREVGRLLTLSEQGKGFAFSVLPLEGGYTDMVQGIGILITQEEARAKMCRLFIESLLAPSSQEKLKPLGVFSTIPDLVLHDDVYYSILEKGLEQNLTVENIFLPNAQREAKSKQAVELFRGKTDSALKRLYSPTSSYHHKGRHSTPNKIGTQLRRP